jgi:hypothetical protein
MLCDMPLVDPQTNLLEEMRNEYEDARFYRRILCLQDKRALPGYLEL